MTLTPAEERLAAWRQLPWACRSCGETQNHRCITSSGGRTSPHAPRIYDIRAYLAGQADKAAENAALTEQVANLKAINDQLVALDKANQDKLDIAMQRIANLQLDLTHAQADNAALQKRIDELTATPPPPPPTTGMLVGAAVGGNADPAPIEKALGKPLDLHRTYWSGSQVAKAVAVAKADIAAKRIPFLTFKLPYSWADMAAGKGDAWAKDLGAKLAALGGPVWLDFHHEPEGDSNGTAAQWTAMQQRIIPLAAQGKVKVGVCYTGYPQTHGDATWAFEKTFPKAAQFLAVDIYQMYGTVNKNTGVRLLKWSPLEDYYGQVDAFAEKVGVPWLLGECGVTDEALVAKPSALADLFTAARNNGCAGLAYFSSSLNSSGSWPLTGAKLAAFAAEANR